MAAFGDFHLVSGAGWSVCWRIREWLGGGLEVWFADFQGKRVLWRGSQPFVIVPYHRPVAFPSGPEHTFKDGLGPKCSGARFAALKRSAPNSAAPPSGSPHWATVDTEAVAVEVEPAGDFGPAALTISAKFQCDWYQYLHKWEFDGDGNIHPHVGLGGTLSPYAKEKAHLHHIYFRIDLDIDGHTTDVFEEFEHVALTDPGGDGWNVQTTQKKLLANPATSRKWRVRDLMSKNTLGEPRGYEIEVPQLAGVDKYSTGDVWVTVYRGDSVQQGEDVGDDCTDSALENVYAVGPLDTTNGSDIVVWVALHAHHEPRHLGEESEYLPYHWHEFSISPRNFAVFKRRSRRRPRE